MGRVKGNQAMGSGARLVVTLANYANWVSSKMEGDIFLFGIRIDRDQGEWRRCHCHCLRLWERHLKHWLITLTSRKISRSGGTNGSTLNSLAVISNKLFLPAYARHISRLIIACSQVASRGQEQFDRDRLMTCACVRVKTISTRSVSTDYYL